MTMRRQAGWAALGLCACVLGHRGEAAFAGDHELTGVASVRIELPSTPVTVFACDAAVPSACPPRLVYQGVWQSTAGTRGDATATAEAPELVFERFEGVGELRAEVPLAVEGLVDLLVDEIKLPNDRDLEIHTDLGDVSVFGVEAAVSVDLGRGDVEVRGGDAGIGVRNGLGDVELVTRGPVDLELGEGDVRVEQVAIAASVHIRVGRGDVRLVVADAANLDLELQASGDIRVRTPEITAITSGRFARRTGSGATRVEIRSDRGTITLEEGAGR